MTRVDEALVVLTSVEQGDERAPELVARHASAEIAKLAAQLKVTTVVLHPFADLFAALSTPEVAIDVLSRTQQTLTDAGLHVHRTPFGWFNTLDALRVVSHFADRRQGPPDLTCGPHGQCGRLK